MILAGDIGGTKTVLTLYEQTAGGLRSERTERYPSADFGGLPEVVDRFLGEAGAPGVEAAGFGIAGPVIAGRAVTTNLPWKDVEASELARHLGLESVVLLNDLAAAAYGMLVLPDEDLVQLNPGVEADRGANMAVVAAGTGLGEALLIWDGERHIAVATEGGHVDFPPRNEEEIELLRFLQRELGRVSSERILAGPGLHNVYRFVREHVVGEPEPDWLRERMAQEDPSAVVSSVALEKRDAGCVRALELFVRLYGAEAGNMALKVLAVGGVFVGGGIAPKILPALQTGDFLEAFLAKGRFRELLEQIPVRVATNSAAPLLGAAHQAAGLL
ncbi:MAG: glucokinase [Myxococcota bacterium]|nr:glucokinase [Myxococcota bacterium]